MARLTISDTGRGIASEDREPCSRHISRLGKNGNGARPCDLKRIVADHGGYIGWSRIRRETRFFPDETNIGVKPRLEETLSATAGSRARHRP